MNKKLLTAVCIVGLFVAASFAVAQHQTGNKPTTATPDPRIDKLLEQNEQILKQQTEILKQIEDVKVQIGALRRRSS